MFKKTKIAAVSAAVLGLSSMAAQAVTINENAADGQVLIFPYYNVNNGFSTSYNITNTTGQTKAVKIRFRESHTSNDVLDFNVYMSPFDVFTLGLLKDADGGVRLFTSDKTCTHPAIPAAGVAFRDVYDSVEAADMREGYLEVIEMGEVNTAATVQVLQADGVTNLPVAIVNGVKHVNGVPTNCDVIELAWQQGVFAQGGAAANSTIASDTVPAKSIGYPNNALGLGQTADANYYGVAPANVLSLNAPTGGLVGSSILVDTINIAGFVVEPISVLNYADTPQHYLSSDKNFYLLPSIASGNVSTANLLNDTATALISTTWGAVARDWGLDDKNVLPRTEVPSGINPMPLADALAVTSIGNQYFLDNGVATDWVMATPMRKHAIYNDYQYIAAGVAGYVPAVIAVPPAVQLPGDLPVAGNLGDATAPSGYWKYLNAVDVNADFKYWDREEAEQVAAPGDFSPPIDVIDIKVPFQSEVNILSLTTGGAGASVLGSDNAQSVALADGFNNGWGAMVFSGYSLADARYTAYWTTTSAAAADVNGVPVAGFMAARGAVNGQNVGETFPHISARDR